MSPPGPPTPATCDTDVPQATAGGGFLEIPGLAGTVTALAHPGAVLVAGAAPLSMLPPLVGTAPLTELTVRRQADAASPALVQAASSGARYPCVHLELGPGPQALYTTYAFHDAQLAGYGPATGPPAAEQLRLTYARVDWEYQPPGGSPVVTGGGALGTTPDPRARPAAVAPASFPAVSLLAPAAVVLAGIGWLWLRRRSRRRPSR
jgi:type VI protein secretion system component Hcp